MPFIVKHVRLTNSRKLPDLFLTAKVQAPSDLADIQLGKLYFVLQITMPWNHAAPIGTSIVNIVSREYFRHDSNLPLQNFERAIAKTNRLIEQLARDGDASLRENIHALIALTVGDELHIAYTGAAEAYFLRNNTLNLITEPASQPPENNQVFNNLITGEISPDDMVILGSPGLYEAITTDDLELVLKQRLSEASLDLAKRIKAQKVRHANAILLHFDTKQAAENRPLAAIQETIYLDQQLESTWQIVRYELLKIGRPLGKLARTIGQKLLVLARQFTSQGQTAWQKAQPKVKEKVAATAQTVQTKAQSILKEQSPHFQRLTQAVKQYKPTLPTLPPLNKPANRIHYEASVPVNHYTARRNQGFSWTSLMGTLIKPIQDIGRQFRRIVRRSPRTWYIVIALVLLSAIGASIQMRRSQTADKPIITATNLEAVKALANEAKQAKVYGNSGKARELYLDVIAQAEPIKQNTKLADEAANLSGTAQKELESLAGATHITALSPILKLTQEPQKGLIYDGVFYYATQDGRLEQLLLTGGDPEQLGQLPDSQAPLQMVLNEDNKTIYIQTYTGELYQYDITRERLKKSELTESPLPVSTGLGFFNNTLYLVDPAENQIWKYPIADDGLEAGTAYLRNQKTLLHDTTGLAIDGSLFTINKSGQVTKFVRGLVQADFKITGIPEPFNQMNEPLGFYAATDSPIYYLADRGNDKIPARIIELDAKGIFTHQYLLPKKWQGEIKMIIGQPKSHKVWALVGNELYELTLVQ